MTSGLIRQHLELRVTERFCSPFTGFQSFVEANHKITRSYIAHLPQTHDLAFCARKHIIATWLSHSFCSGLNTVVTSFHSFTSEVTRQTGISKPSFIFVSNVWRLGLLFGIPQSNVHQQRLIIRRLNAIDRLWRRIVAS